MDNAVAVSSSGASMVTTASQGPIVQYMSFTVAPDFLTMSLNLSARPTVSFTSWAPLSVKLVSTTYVAMGCLLVGHCPPRPHEDYGPSSRDSQMLSTRPAPHRAPLPRLRPPACPSCAGGTISSSAGLCGPRIFSPNAPALVRGSTLLVRVWFTPSPQPSPRGERERIRLPPSLSFSPWGE